MRKTVFGVKMRTYVPTDRALIDLRDKRTDLAIRISLIKDSELPDQSIVFTLQGELELLDRRIAAFRSEPSD